MKRRPISIHPSFVFVVMILLVAPSAFLQGKNVPMWLFGVMCTALILTMIWSRLVLRTLKVRRSIKDPARVGEPYVVRYEVTNTGKWLAGFSVWIEEEQSSTSTWHHHFRKARGWIMEIGTGETVHGESIFWPTTRGEAKFNQFKVSTSFPFGMLRSSKTFHQKVNVLVQPQVLMLRPSVIQSIGSTGPLGRRSRRRGRGGDDFFGLRELLSSDRFGDIAWKASAKRDELVCILRSRPALPRIQIVLDLTTPTEALQCEIEGREAEERAISLCASLMTEAVRQDQEIALTILGCEIESSRTFHSGKRHLGKLLSTLAMIQLGGKRLPMPMKVLSSSQQAGCCVVRPDRTRPIPSVGDAMYFTAMQLSELEKGSQGREAV